jgi:ATP-dependent DNA ligase
MRLRPCLPSPSAHPPVGPGWLHEIKHDGFRLFARRDGERVRLITRGGYDWSDRYPLIAAAAAALAVPSCLIDGEAIACDAKGLADFQLLRRRRHDHAVTL